MEELDYETLPSFAGFDGHMAREVRHGIESPFGLAYEMFVGQIQDALFVSSLNTTF